jgi:hypothetical protein
MFLVEAAPIASERKRADYCIGYDPDTKQFFISNNDYIIATVSESSSAELLAFANKANGQV